MNYPRLSFFCLMFLTKTTNCCASVSIRVRSFSLSSFGGRLLISYRNLSASLPIRMGVFLIGLAILFYFITLVGCKNKQKNRILQTFHQKSAYFWIWQCKGTNFFTDYLKPLLDAYASFWLLTDYSPSPYSLCNIRIILKSLAEGALTPFIAQSR